MIMKKAPILACVIALLVGVALFGVRDFSLDHHRVSQLSFSVQDRRVAGTLVMPQGEGPFPIALIVHGDGPATRFLDGAILPFVNALLDKGIGVFAWDKPGTGDSPGNWLAQSMIDRSAEAVAAFHAVSGLEVAQGAAVGFVGFSQAGWVVPEAVRQVDPAFTALIGAAVNWRDQAAYLTRQRLISEGVSAARAAEASVAQQLRDDAALRRDTPDPAAFPGMDADRLAFVHRNYAADSTQALSDLKGPVLALWGAGDRNTDPQRNASRFGVALRSDARADLWVVPAATHSLLKAGLFNYQTPQGWPWYAKWAYLGLGRRAYAEGALDLITDWILRTASAADL